MNTIETATTMSEFKALPCLAHTPTLAVLLLFLTARAFSGESATADLSFKLAPDRTARYVWTTTSNTETSGRERGEAFSFKADLSIVMNVVFKGLAPKGPGMRLGLRIENYAYNDKKTMGAEVGEIQASRGKIKVIQNGKTVVDSDNDISVEDVKEFQKSLKSIEDGQMIVTLEPNGKEVGEAAGESTVIDTIKATGAEGMMRLLPGRDLTPGQTWEDSQSMPSIATFKLAKPLVVRSTSTFAGWETKDGKRVARIDIKTIWDPAELKGENGEGMLVEVSHVQGVGAGTALFDPASGQFVEGLLEATSRYRIDGKKDGLSTGLDVISKTKFTFKQIP